MAQEIRKPIKEFRAGNIKAAIWEDEREDQDRTVVRHSVKIQKRFFDKTTGEWRDTDYFFVNGLPRLRLVAERAFEFIVLQREAATTATVE
ncbi:MAG: hypothetical protein KJ749_05835 [Planctomycetes bacterium]|nr:hypothetical protein [Planctomycetota bacterium]